MQLAPFWTELDSLQPILDTVRADDLAADPAAIRERYERAARTYFPLDPVRDVETILRRRLKEGKPVTGYIAADYGYGKTAAAIYLWRALDRDTVMAVPPFILRRLQDLVVAVNAWTKASLTTSAPHLLPRLHEAFTQFSDQSIESLAKQLRNQVSLSTQQAEGVARLFIDKARLDGGLVATYLQQVTAIVREAGYRGLAVFADELQEYLRTEENTREAFQNLSELIKDIRAWETVPLSLMLVMPVNPTETAFASHAGDVIQRMAELGTRLRLEDAYDHTFPARLWNHLVETAQTPDLRSFLPPTTLEALGQLITDKALSNGPRTLINVFKQVAIRARADNRPYTPLDLADDYVKRQIVFDGAGHRVTQLLHELLDLPAVRGQPEREAALKLLAMFPAGAGRPQLGELYETVLDLWEQERFGGERLTRTSLGYALVGLRHEIATESALDSFLRQFQSGWNYEWSPSDKLERAFSAFVDHAVAKLFPPRTQGAFEGFSRTDLPSELALEDFRVEPKGYDSASRPALGSINRAVRQWKLVGGWQNTISQFPDRSVGLVVALDDVAAARASLPRECDVEFRITLRLSSPNQPLWIEATQGDHRIDLKANLARTFGQSRLPFALGMLETLIAPERASALLLLALANAFDRWLATHPDLSSHDREQFKEKRDECVSHALQLLFPDPRNAGQVEVVGLSLRSDGERAEVGAATRLLASLLSRKCQQRYPQYRPLKTTKEWNSLLNKYRQALASRPLAERRGLEPFHDTKNAVAAAFSLAPSSFPAGVRYYDERGLLHVDAWRGAGATSDAAVRFLEHPLETLLLTEVREKGQPLDVLSHGRPTSVRALPRAALIAAGRKLGYLEEEVHAAIELAKARQRLSEQDGTVREFGPALDADSLRAELDELQTRYRRLEHSFHDDLFKHRGKKSLDDAADLLHGEPNEIDLDTANTSLEKARERLAEFVRQKGATLTDQLKSHRAALDDIERSLNVSDLDSPLDDHTPLAKHLLQYQERLVRNLSKLRDDIAHAKDGAYPYLPPPDEISDDDLIKLANVVDETRLHRQKIDSAASSLRTLINDLARWKELCHRFNLFMKRFREESELLHQLRTEFEEPVLELFAIHKWDALARHHEFAATLARLENEAESLLQQRREEEQRAREARKTAWLNRLEVLTGIVQTVAPKLQTEHLVYADDDLERVNRGLATSLRNSLSETLEQCEGQIHAIQETVRYLEWFRNLSLLDEQRTLDRLASQSKLLVREIDDLPLLEIEPVRCFVEQINHLQTELGRLTGHLHELRRQRPAPDPHERALLDVLDHRWQTLETLAVAAPGSQPLESLVHLLEGLYRKGYIEVQVRRAQGDDEADRSA